MERVYIETSGCSINQSDSEVMAGLLKKAGFELVDKLENSDLVILNTCTVKGPTEHAFWKRIEEIKGSGKNIIIAGCIAQTEPEKLKDYSLIGPSQVNNIVSVVEETINGNTVALLVKEKNPRLNLPKIRRNNVVEIVHICAGCLGDPCAYCKVKDARGELFSYDKDAIVKQVSDAVKDGVKEVWLTAQDTGCYGLDIGTNLVELLKSVVALKGDFKVRVGMMNPNHVVSMLDGLVAVFRSDKLFKFLHIPVQSGNDVVLGRMRRKYSVDDFKRIVGRFRREFPEITIATDMICGFPCEDEDQFQDSIKLVRDTNPDVLNISRFWPRPGTEAASMDGQIHGNETKKRSQTLTSVFKTIMAVRNERWIGWKGEILIDDIDKDNSVVGRNYSYKPIVVPGSFEFGKKLFVEVKKVTPHYLIAEIVK